MTVERRNAAPAPPKTYIVPHLQKHILREDLCALACPWERTSDHQCIRLKSAFYKCETTRRDLATRQLTPSRRPRSTPRGAHDRLERSERSSTCERGPHVCERSSRRSSWAIRRSMLAPSHADPRCIPTSRLRFLVFPSLATCGCFSLTTHSPPPMNCN